MATSARIPAIVVFCLLTIGYAQSSSDDWKSVPHVDAGAGKCAVDFTVVDTAHKPVYAATIKVHVDYGFMGARKLDLEVGTNAEGKGRFEGLPEKVKRPLLFMVTKENLRGTATYDPATECKAKREVVMEKQAEQASRGQTR